MSLKVTINAGIAEVVMAYNPVNALAIAEVHEVAEKVSSLGAQEEVRVILLGNEGKGFCVGANVKELNADNSLITESNRAWFRVFAAIYECEVPVISVVDGYCLGGGIGIAGASDIVFASEDSSFSLPEVKVGALGGASHLMRLVGTMKTRSMMYTGESLGAEEFARYGGIEAVVPSTKLWPAARAMAEKICANEADAIRLAKESLNGIEAVDIRKSYRFEQGFTLELYTSPRAAAARAAQVKSGFKK